MGKTLDILCGTSTNYNSVWADPNANINSGNVYVTTTSSGASFSVVDLQNDLLIDCYTTTISGSYDEALESENIEDLNISILGG